MLQRPMTVAAVLVTLIFFNSSCGKLKSVINDPVKEATDQIEKSVNDINANSTQWQNIINQLPDKLKGKVDDTIQNELTRFVEHSVGVVSQQTVCTTDILAKRAILFLNKLKQAILGKVQKTNLTAPTVCQVPSNIELSAMPKGHRIIEASGADFNIRDDKNNLIRVAFRSDSNDKNFPIDESRVGRNTNYNLAINLDGEDIPKLVKENEINKILFYWNESNVEQPQVLVLKRIPGTNETTISIGNVSLIPRLVGGDRGTDINDDNPFVTEVAGKVFISTDQRQVLYNLYMHGRENQPDHTEVNGWLSEVQTGVKEIKIFKAKLTFPVFGEGPGLVAYTAPDGWKIVSVTPLGETKGNINITKHGNQEIYKGDGQVVRVFVVNGGEGGGEAGNQTGVVATFSNLLVKIKEIED